MNEQTMWRQSNVNNRNILTCRFGINFLWRVGFLWHSWLEKEICAGETMNHVNNAVDVWMWLNFEIWAHSFHPLIFIKYLKAKNSMKLMAACALSITSGSIYCVDVMVTSLLCLHFSSYEIFGRSIIKHTLQMNSISLIILTALNTFPLLSPSTCSTRM